MIRQHNSNKSASEFTGAIQYTEFNEEFGHLFYKTPYSHYLLIVEYRFLDGQLSLGPKMARANRNNV